MHPWNIAHRGGAQLMPENTLAAFADALARGCDGVELDVQLTPRWRGGGASRFPAEWPMWRAKMAHGWTGPVRASAI